MKRFACHSNNFLYYDMRICKPLAIIGILAAAAFLAACDTGSLTGDKSDTAYTDVEYLEDGTEVRLYLDGVGVPKSRAQRAITTDLAKSAFDFVEVIFVNGNAATPANIVRTSWVLGQPASIVNVARGVNYNSIYTSNGNAACMFVGREDGKVLLGVGQLTGSRRENGSSGGTTVYTDTRYVTFTLAAIQTGLLVDNETAGSNTVGVAVDSFTYYRESTDALNVGGTLLAGGGYFNREGNSFRRDIGGTSYPVYTLPIGDPASTFTYAQYKFYFWTNSTDNTTAYSPAIRHQFPYAASNRSDVIITKKTPRYSYGLQYIEPRNLIDTGTGVAARDLYRNGAVAGAEFANPVLLQFSSNSSRGLFSFNIQIPVFMVSTTAAGGNNGTAAVIWNIRTGVGTEFYSLDDGVSRGGCVLMSVGIPSSEWYNIEWTWFKGF